MRRKVEEQAEARRLRALGWSVGRIATELGVSKSSVSVWVRGLPRPPRRPRPAKAAGRPMGAPVEEGPGKRCYRCRRELTFESFNRAGSGRQDWCRECFRAYFRDRGSIHRAQSRRAREARMEAARRLVMKTLSSSPCADCGEDEIVVLEFDHLGQKRDHIARMMRAGRDLDTLQDELDGCEVVCACCHRRRTARRARWFRATGVHNPRWTDRQRVNQEHLLSVLRFAGCVDCGESDPVVLEFDHVGEKETQVTKLAMIGSFERLKIEIAQCEVRCCNCHRLVTYARRGGTWKDSLEWMALDEVL